MPNYQQAKIYKIECNISGKIYVGSTCEPTLARRLAGHVGDYKKYLNGNHNYVSSFDIIKNGNYDIVLIESFTCNSKDELYAKERYWTNKLDCVNRYKNQGLFNELGEKEYKKAYREINKDKINEKNKEYYDNNKEYFKEHNKEYYDNNKERINEKNNCQCGGLYTNANKSKHIKSQKHQNYIKTLNNGIKPII